MTQLLFSRSSWHLSLFGWISSMQKTWNMCMPLVRISVDSVRFLRMSGVMTLSSNWPFWQASATAVSFPMTW